MTWNLQKIRFLVTDCNQSMHQCITVCAVSEVKSFRCHSIWLLMTTCRLCPLKPILWRIIQSSQERFRTTAKIYTFRPWLFFAMTTESYTHFSQILLDLFLFEEFIECNFLSRSRSTPILRESRVVLSIRRRGTRLLCTPAFLSSFLRISETMLLIQ